MANTAYEITSSGDGDTIGTDEAQFSRRFYVEVDNLNDHLALALQLPGLVGSEAVPWDTPHQNHAYLTAQRFTIERHVQQAKAPKKGYVRVEYLPRIVTPTDIIASGWEPFFDIASATAPRRFDLDGKPPGPQHYQAVPFDVFGPADFIARSPSGVGGIIDLRATGRTVDEPRDVPEPAGVFGLRKTFRTGLSEAQLQAVASYTTTVNASQFFYGPGLVLFKTFRANYSTADPTAPQAAARATDDLTGLKTDVVLYFEWNRRGYQLDEIELWTDDEGFVTPVERQLGPEPGIVRRQRRIVDVSEFRSMLAVLP